MSISLTEDFKTVEELQQHAVIILNQARKTGQPVNITMQGKPVAVLLDVATFERLVRTINLVRLLAPAEEDILAGRTTPLEEFMSEFCSANNIPRSGSSGSSKGRSNGAPAHRKGQKTRRGQVGS
jgi:prevent-host-death family protein